MRLPILIFAIVIFGFFAILISPLNPQLNSLLVIPLYKIPDGEINRPASNQLIESYKSRLSDFIIKENKPTRSDLKTFCAFKTYGTLTTPEFINIYILRACTEYFLNSGLQFNKKDPEYMVLMFNTKDNQVVNYIKINAISMPSYLKFLGYDLTRIFPNQISSIALNDQQGNSYQSDLDNLFKEVNDQAVLYFYHSN